MKPEARQMPAELVHLRRKVDRLESETHRLEGRLRSTTSAAESVRQQLNLVGEDNVRMMKRIVNLERMVDQLLRISNR